MHAFQILYFLNTRNMHFFFIILSMLLFPSDSDEQGISQVRQTPEDHTFSLHQTPTASADVFTIIELHHSCFSVPY